MKLSRFFTKSKKVFNIKLLVALAIVLVFIFSMVFWPETAKKTARDFLPTNTSFFYEWANKKSLDNNFPATPKLFNYDIPAQQISYLQKNLGGIFNNIEDLVWFRVNHTKNDNYIIHFSGLSPDTLEEFEKKHSDYIYYQPDKEILVITQAPEVIEDIKNKTINSFSINHIKQGINLYWYLNQPPDFLQGISTLLEPSFAEQRTFMNIYLDNNGKGNINIFQVNNNPSVDSSNLASLKIPYYLDSAIGFSASSTSSLDNFLVDNLLLPVYDNLPYYNLNKDNVATYFLQDDIIFQKDDDWLIISKEDKKSQLFDFLGDFKTKEVDRLLPDGTAYVELVADPDFEFVDHQLMNQSYWQTGSLFGMDLGKYHYLSNRQYLIEDSIKSNRKMGDLWNSCLPSNSFNVRDFIIWNSSQLPNSAIKGYLEDNNIESLQVFSYYNSIITGLKWCL